MFQGISGTDGVGCSVERERQSRKQNQYQWENMDAQFQVQVAQLGKSTVVFGDGGSQLPGYCAAVIRL